MSTEAVVSERKRTADFNKIREHGIYCSKNMQPAIVQLPNERKLFISINMKSREPRLRFYTAAEDLQW